jgi:O-antigen/teichoic acid export membrane protein
MTDESSILKDSLGALIVRVVGIMLTFGSTILAARTLGTEIYGEFASSLSLAMLLAALAPLGTDRVLAKRLSISSDHPTAAQEIALTFCSTMLLAGLLLGTLLFLTAVGRLLRLETAWLSMLICSAAMFVPLSMLYLRQWAAIPLVGTRRALQTDQILLPFLYCSSLAIVAVLRFKPTTFVVAILYAACVIVSLALSLNTGSLRRLNGAAVRLVSSIKIGQVATRLRLGLPFATVSIGGVISQTCMPMMIAVACGFQEAGYFGIAASFAAIPLIPLGVFNLSLIPLCSRHFQEQRVSKVEHSVRSTATFTFSISAVISIGLWLCSPVLTSVLGHQYSSVAGLLPALLLAAMVDCMTGPTVPVMQSMGMEHFYTRAMLIFVPCQYMIVLVAGRMAGVEGAAVGYLIARCAWNVAVCLQIYRCLGLRMLPYLNILTTMRPLAQGSFTTTDPCNEVPSLIDRLRRRVRTT